MAGDAASDIAPASDQLEISLFGPGYGECAVLYFGGRDWVIIDSCVRSGSRRPVALDYLERIGVDVAAEVRVVVATHWHDDHIRGLAAIVREAKKARFVISTAMSSDQFLTLVSLVEPSTMLRSSGVREFADVLAALGEHTPPTFAIADRRIWQPAGTAVRGVWSLSPSDRSYQLALDDLGSLIDDPERPNRRVPSLRPNHASVALWCEMGDINLLFGADLEDTAEPGTGWRAIIASTAKPSGRATVFKVPHHGSPSSHNEDVWTEMVDGDAIAILTPFRRGRVHLPTSADCTRICSLARTALITQDSEPTTATTWDPTVEAVLSESTLSLTDAEPPVGHIRLRRVIGASDWSVELFGGAADLCRSAA